MINIFHLLTFRHWFSFFLKFCWWKENSIRSRKIIIIIISMKIEFVLFLFIWFNVYNFSFWETDIKAVRQSNRSTIRRKYGGGGGYDGSGGGGGKGQSWVFSIFYFLNFRFFSPFRFFLSILLYLNEYSVVIESNHEASLRIFYFYLSKIVL